MIDKTKQTLERPAQQQEPVLRRIMQRLADLLDEDHFAEIESIVAGAGVTPPAQRKPLTDEREAFEAHWYTKYHSGSVSARSDGSYVHPHVQRAWEAWLARAAQE